ncbi:hypothetical protein [Nioella sp. MMSF_3534]|uniref:hypothetical protein n=1 Tax=Nioella sp. MMSF_3534 TaxID=3046720 RepID=UPI00273D98C9|nr:hypothetical protein [Nioella sp. MMSF_3534]
MSGFFRPEAMATLRRWREALIGLAVLAVGGFVALAALTVIILGVGIAFSAIGLFLLWGGIQRGRFRQAAIGPGIVTLDEGRVTYMGPLDGGVIDIEDMTVLMLDGRSRPPVWVLRQNHAAPVHIPVNATGADRLFDAFLRLPGIHTGQMVWKLNRAGNDLLLIWEREDGLGWPQALN